MAIVYSELNYIFSDRLFRTMADILVNEGYAALGYEYVNIDDCWLEKDRGIDGTLQPDRERFPYGMKDLADYVIIIILSIYTINYFMKICFSAPFKIT